MSKADATFAEAKAILDELSNEDLEGEVIAAALRVLVAHWQDVVESNNPIDVYYFQKGFQQDVDDLLAKFKDMAGKVCKSIAESFNK